MLCQFILTHGKRKHQTCQQPKYKNGPTCSLHKKKVDAFCESLLKKKQDLPDCIKECIREQADQGDYSLTSDYSLDCINHPFITLIQESIRNYMNEEEAFCIVYRILFPDRAIKIIDNKLYLSDSFIIQEGKEEKEKEKKCTRPKCTSLLKTLDELTFLQFKEDFTGMNMIDMKPLFLHYQFPITFQWDDEHVHSLFNQILFESK
jgi:hypothetical protein